MKKRERSGDSVAPGVRPDREIRTSPVRKGSTDVADHTDALIHELEMQQIELEHQNEELRRVQLEMVESRDRFAELYDFAPVGYLSLAGNGTILEANLAAANLLGLGRRELLRTRITRFIRESREVFFRHQAKTLQEKVKQVCEVEMLRADGRPLTARLESVPFGPEERRQCRTAIIDVTEIRQALRALEQSQERYQRLTAAVTDYVYRVQIEHGRESKPLHGANCGSFTGYTPEEFDARPGLWIEMLPLEDRPRVREHVNRILTRRPAPAIEHRIRRKDGRIRWVLNTISAEYDAQDRLIAYDGLLRDITKRKDAEDALLRLNLELEQRVEARTNDLRRLSSELCLAEERERRRIAAELHDELGQVLAMCRNELDRIDRSEVSEKTLQAVARAKELLARADAETRELTFELGSPMLSSLGLVPALEQLCRDLQKEHGITFDFRDDESDKPLNEAMRIVLYRSVRELLINVIKHAEASQAVCTVFRVDGSIRVEVSDNGLGFDATDAGTGFSAEGGFGLFNMREYVNHVGGRLDIESIPGDGSKIVLEVPLSGSEPRTDDDGLRIHGCGI